MKTLKNITALFLIIVVLSIAGDAYIMVEKQESKITAKTSFKAETEAKTLSFEHELTIEPLERE